MTHTCKICGTTSDASEFYAGVRSRCKECHKARSRKNRAAKIDYYREYDSMRFQKNPMRRAAIMAYQSTERGKIVMAASRKKWVETNADKRAAHVILGNAVRDGRVAKPTLCSACGCGGKIHGHHDDYALPLSVKWLCPKCHRKEHQ